MKTQDATPNITCAECNVPIYRRPGCISDRNFCSTACRNKGFAGYHRPDWRSVKSPDRTRAQQRDRRDRVKRMALDLLGGRCSSCGYSKCPSALDFHHIDPATKDQDIKSLIQRRWEVIKEEVMKCIILCANCHREQHFLERRGRES